MASSVVAEISPVLLLLKSNISFNALIIEEPEAHLHPLLQVEMAKLIVLLVNNDIPIWITTHSDTILQHINNMIKLHNNKEKESLFEEYGYDGFSTIDTERVNMYQFSCKESGITEIAPLESTKYGFVVPTFNNALESITEEIVAFQEGLE